MRSMLTSWKYANLTEVYSILALFKNSRQFFYVVVDLFLRIFTFN